MRETLPKLAAALFAGGVLVQAVLPAAAGTADVLVSQSYALGEYLDTVQRTAAQAAGAVYAGRVEAPLAQAEAAQTEAAIRQTLGDAVAAAVSGGTAADSRTLAVGATLTCPTGAELTLQSGGAMVTAGRLIDLTAGGTIEAGASLVRGRRYLTDADGTVLRMTAAGRMAVRGSVQQGMAPAGTDGFTPYADALAALSLFQGGSQGYELDRAATRVEGVVMLIRLLGQEADARAFTGGHPFTDVPAWADRYVAYAYARGYTSGVSATAFGASMALRYQDHMTFLLRALGYDDSKGEFSWASADQTAVRLGIQTAAEREAIRASGKFLRGHVAYTAYRALTVPCRDGGTLADRLIGQGVFSRRDWQQVLEKGL